MSDNLVAVGRTHVLDGWRLMRLGDHLGLCRNGLVCPQDANKSNAIPVTRIETISDGKVDWTRVGWVSPDHANPEYLLQKGDILFSHINSVKHIGKVARVTENRPLLHGMNLMALRSSPSLDPGFGFLFLAWEKTKRYVESLAKKAVNQASVNTQDISNLPILLPPLPEQRAIAAVLDAIDDAIERTEAVIAATERLRGALLHELLTRGVPGWHTEWKEAPGVGTIPADWEVVRLGDVAEVRSGVGFPLDKQGRQSGAFPFIKVSDMNLPGNETHIRVANNYIEQENLHELGANVFAPGTIVFPKVGAAIATNKKRVLTHPTIIDNNMAGVTVAVMDKCDSSFLYCWFKSIDLFDFANVSAVPSITGARLKRALIPFPPLSEQKTISAILDGVDVAVERAREEQDGLQLLKASASDALLTGRVRAPVEKEETHA